MKHIIDEFIPQGGKHCVTNALKQIFNYYGHEVSEEYLLGLASGISFCYLNLSNSPMVLGRAKPFVFEQKVAERFSIIIRCKQTKNNQKALEIIKQSIDCNKPIQIYVDMPFLPYLDMNENNHFGGHSIVVYGYDDNKQIFYVSDRDSEEIKVSTEHGMIASPFHTVSYADMEKAHGSVFRPFPALNKYLEFDFTYFCEPSTDILRNCILEVCHTMLNPPANLLGIKGIMKFSKEIKKWDKFDKEKLKKAGYTNYYQIHADGGSGGGGFRNMYGLFLCEISEKVDDRLFQIGRHFIDTSFLWDEIALDMKKLSIDGDKTLLDIMSKQIFQLYNIEKNLFEQLYMIVS